MQKTINPTTTKPSTTFRVDKVTKSTKHLPTTSLKNVIRQATKGVGKTPKRISVVHYVFSLLFQVLFGWLTPFLPTAKK